jgi:predicted enzyme related to lactoylglutathione lyase
MRRLLYVVSFTTDLDQTKRFYRDGIGLSIGADTPFMANFGSEGTGLVLLAVNASTKREVELCFEAPDAPRAVEDLRGRGVQFVDELRQLSFGSVIHFRDPEGNLLSLLQPGSAEQEAGHGRRGEALAAAQAGQIGMQTALALEESARESVRGPRLTTAIVNGRDLGGLRGFYRDWVGLHMSVDSPHWIQFETGDIHLALHSRQDRSPSSPMVAQSVGFGITVEDLEAWVEQARARGVTFASAPTETALGLTAEVLDPEGNMVLVRERVSEETLEERLAESYEDDEPRKSSIRRPIAKSAHGPTSRLAIRPEYGAKKRAARKATTKTRKGTTLRVASPRGTGPERSRAKPKSLKDPKRAKAFPAIGRLKKAEARTFATKKQAVADASKRRPVKRAAARRGKGKSR